ncbi:MAG: low molecular weight phosphotyrosine protein phosphatase [Fibrobacter sp.]|nr:low molecular weight phosphotyrosine protein phosphatase [Fibrobacter sp.]
MITILFVCHGNICRSPMAEFVMKRLVQEELPASQAADFEIASAATSTEEIGNPVYPPAKRMLNAHGIDCSGKTARQMTQADFEHYDYIVLMDKNNLRNLRWILPANVIDSPKISLLMDYTSHPRDVADPWYTGDFHATWNDVTEGCRGLLREILSSRY